MDFKDVFNQAGSLHGTEVSVDGIIAGKIGQSHWYLTDLESLSSKSIDRSIRLVDKFKFALPSKQEYQESLEKFFTMFAAGKFGKASEAEARTKHSKLLVKGTEDDLNFFIESGALSELNQVLEVPSQRHRSSLISRIDLDKSARIQNLNNANYFAYMGTVVGTINYGQDEITLTNLKSITIYSSNGIRYITRDKMDLDKFDLGVAQFATSNEIFESPEKYLGKRVRVGKYWILTHSSVPFIVPSFAHGRLKNRERYGLLIESPQFEKEVTNVRLIRLNTTNTARFERMELVGEIAETSQSPFKFSIKEISAAVYDTAIGIYHWKSPEK